jgi:hypothetical protein
LTDRAVARYSYHAVPLARWLVSLVTLLTLLGQPLGAFASAGEKAEVTCCCPDPEMCKCHDHDGHGTDTMKRCAGAEHQVMPVLAVATIAAIVESIDVLRAHHVVEHRSLPIPDSVSSEPETPPF